MQSRKKRLIKRMSLFKPFEKNHADDNCDREKVKFNDLTFVFRAACEISCRVTFSSISFFFHACFELRCFPLKISSWNTPNYSENIKISYLHLSVRRKWTCIFQLLACQTLSSIPTLWFHTDDCNWALLQIIKNRYLLKFTLKEAARGLLSSPRLRITSCLFKSSSYVSSSSAAELGISLYEILSFSITGLIELTL